VSGYFRRLFFSRCAGVGLSYYRSCGRRYGPEVQGSSPGGRLGTRSSIASRGIIRVSGAVAPLVKA
jgi:hypothetical protein